MKIFQIQQRLLHMQGTVMIREAYWEWMNRPPNQRERKYWHKQLLRKLPKQIVLKRLLCSEEVKGFLTGHPPAQSATAPTRTIQIIYRLFHQPEEQYVASLFQELLDRSPEPHEQHAYHKLLNSQADYWPIFEAIILSYEAQTLWLQAERTWTVHDLLNPVFAQDGPSFVRRLSRELLARNPLKGEVRRLAGKTVSSQGKDKVLASLLYSRAFRSALVQRRVPNGRWTNGWAIDRLRRVYRLSGVKFVTGLYQELLGREPDPEGFELHLKMLKKSRKLDLIRGMLLSQEATLRRKAFSILLNRGEEPSRNLIEQVLSQLTNQPADGKQPDVKVVEFRPVGSDTPPERMSVEPIRYETAVNWHSIVESLSGYATSSRNLMLALNDELVRVSYRYVFGPGTSVPLEETGVDYDARINSFRDREWNPLNPEVVYGFGDVFHRNSSNYKIGYTMLESTRIPQEWIRQANLMDEVWVPTHFNLETFQNSGVQVPIHVMPLGVDPNYYNPSITGRRFTEKYTFLSVFEWTRRKSPVELIRRFCNEFENENDVVLLLKVNVDVRQEIRDLGLGKNVEKIYLMYNQKIPAHLMGELYRSADCFVLPTHGEGWGMPILEAMACGLPTIATDWSGQRDFLNRSTGYPIQVKKLVPIEQSGYYAASEWAEPDWDHLTYLMRHVYENRTVAKQKGVEAAQSVLQHWSWHEAAKKIKNRLMALQANQ